MMFSTSRPAAEPVSRDSATDTRATPLRSNRSSSSHRSLTLRVSRSSLATMTVFTLPASTIARSLTIPGRFRLLADSPLSMMMSLNSAPWTKAMARIFSAWASSEIPCLSVETRT